MINFTTNSEITLKGYDKLHYTAQTTNSILISGLGNFKTTHHYTNVAVIQKPLFKHNTYIHKQPIILNLIVAFPIQSKLYASNNNSLRTQIYSYKQTTPYSPDST